MARNRRITAGKALIARLLWAIPVVLAGAFLAGGCVDPPPEVAVDDPALAEGREIYGRNCASCHGSDGGGGVGPKLNEGTMVETYPAIEDQIDLIANGKGSMPAYVGRLNGEEIEAVSRYTREVL